MGLASGLFLAALFTFFLFWSPSVHTQPLPQPQPGIPPFNPNPPIIMGNASGSETGALCLTARAQLVTAITNK
jgi:hypothetical protein